MSSKKEEAGKGAGGDLPRINKISELPSEEAKWVEFKKIEWTDVTGRDRVWEAAARKTRGKSGVDAVAIAPILHHPTLGPCTVIEKQYRPPIGAYCIELPAGLVDASESVEEAAVRELKEETGYVGRVTEVSPVVVSDPGLTTANMVLAVVEVDIKEGDKEPDQELDEGEHIERMTVPLKELWEKLNELAKEDGIIVDARLFHWATGMHTAQRLFKV